MDDDVQVIHDLIVKQGEAFDKFKAKQEARFEALEAQTLEAEKKAGRQGMGAGAGNSGNENLKSLDLAIRALVAGDQAKANHYFGEVKGMSVGSDPDGGYVVTPTFSSDMTKVMLEIAPFLGLARTVDIVGDSFDEPIDDDAAGAQWVGEAQARTETATPQIGMFSCPVHEIQAEPRITQKLIDTARIDVVAWLQGKVAEKFAATEVDAFFNGDGVNRPRGILSYPVSTLPDATRPRDTIQALKTGVDGGWPAANQDILINVLAELKPQFRSGAVWMMNRRTIATVQKFKDLEGRYLWAQSIVEGKPSALMGYPVIEAEQMPDIATGAIPVAFGNFKKGYTIVRRLGVRFLVDPFTTKPFVKLYAFTRVGGGVNNTQAVKLLQFSA